MNQRTFANFFILSISIVEPSVPAENNLNSSARKSEHDTGLPAKWNRTMVWKTSLIHLKTYLHQIIIVKLNPDMISSGGSGKGPGGRLPPLFLDQTQARRAEKFFFSIVLDWDSWSFTRWVPALTITIRTNHWERTDTFKRVFKNSYLQLQFQRHESAVDTKIPEKGGSWHGWWTWLVAADLISAAPLCFHSQHTSLPLVCQVRLWRPQLGTRPHQSTWHRQSCLSGDWIQTRQLLLATKWRGG